MLIAVCDNCMSAMCLYVWPIALSVVSVADVGPPIQEQGARFRQ